MKRVGFTSVTGWFEVFGINGRDWRASPQPAFTSNVWCVRRRGGEGVVRGVVARRVVGRRRSVHGRIRTVGTKGS